MSKPSYATLLSRHKLHAGVYRRVAARLNLGSSYVSLVASGKRGSKKVKKAIEAELLRIDQTVA
jgi:hypothetical protein